MDPARFRLPNTFVPRAESLTIDQLRAIIISQRSISMPNKCHNRVLTSDLPTRTRNSQRKGAQNDYNLWLSGKKDMNVGIALKLKRDFLVQLQSMPDLHGLVTRILHISSNVSANLEEKRAKGSAGSSRRKKRGLRSGTSESDTEAKDTDIEDVYMVPEVVPIEMEIDSSTVFGGESSNQFQNEQNVFDQEINQFEREFQIGTESVEPHSEEKRFFTSEQLKRYLNGLNPTSLFKLTFLAALRSLAVEGKVPLKVLTKFLKTLRKAKPPIIFKDLPSTGQTLLKTTNEDRLGAVIYDIYVSPREFFESDDDLRVPDDSDHEDSGYDSMVAEHVWSRSNRTGKRLRATPPQRFQAKRPRRSATYQSRKKETTIPDENIGPSRSQSRFGFRLKTKKGRIFVGKYCHFGLERGIFGDSIGTSIFIYNIFCCMIKLILVFS